MQLHTIDPAPARAVVSALSPEVFTVSGLLSMPAVWTAVVDRALPFDVLLERFLIVLLTIALLTELIRRLGEGGALPAPAASGAGDARPLFDADVFETASPLAPFGDADAGPAASPLDGLDDFDAAAAFGTPAADGFDDLDGFGDLGADGFDLSPLDLNADPFADPV